MGTGEAGMILGKSRRHSPLAGHSPDGRRLRGPAAGPEVM